MDSCFVLVRSFIHEAQMSRDYFQSLPAAQILPRHFGGENFDKSMVNNEP